MNNEICNVEYFYLKCNELLNTTYTFDDWGGRDNRKNAINIEWVIAATQRIYNQIHNPKNSCRLLLSGVFLVENSSKLSINIETINNLIEYLKGFNKPCISDVSECYINRNCNCVCTTGGGTNCSGPGACASSTVCTCNCNCTCPNCACACNCNCACECAKGTECVCDCKHLGYECNCTMPPGVNYVCAQPMQQNCVCTGGNCNCNCACNCNCTCPNMRQTQR